MFYIHSGGNNKKESTVGTILNENILLKTIMLFPCVHSLLFKLSNSFLDLQKIKAWFLRFAYSRDGNVRDFLIFS